jgi:hypothetical protein
LSGVSRYKKQIKAKEKKEVVQKINLCTRVCIRKEHSGVFLRKYYVA